MASAITKRKNQKKTELNNYLKAIDNDAAFIDSVHDCVSQSLDAHTARVLLTKKTYDIFNLVQDNEKHELKCFYALHAILLALVSEDRDEILNEMSDANIDTLKKCIVIAQKRIRPNVKIAENKRDMRSAEIAMGITPNSMVCNGMIKTAQIALNVNVFWDEAVAELQKWSDAIKNYKRPQSEDSVEKIDRIFEIQPDDNSEVSEAKENTEPKKEVELWTTDMLVEKLGCKTKAAFQTKKSEIIKNNADRADEIRGWFIVRWRRPALFKAEFFGELQKLWTKGATKQKTVRNTKKNTSVAKPVVNKEEKQKTAKQPKTLSDVKALEAYIVALCELCDNADKAVKSSETVYENAMKEAATAKPADRRKLLEHALNANDKIAEAQSTFDEFKQRLDTAKKLLQDKKHAEETLHNINAEITKMLREFKQNQQ